MFHNELHNLQHSLGGSLCEANLRDSMHSKGWHTIKSERAKSNARNRDTARRKKNKIIIKARVHHKSSRKTGRWVKFERILLRNDGQTREKKIKPRNNHGHATNEKKVSANQIKYVQTDVY